MAAQWNKQNTRGTNVHACVRAGGWLHDSSQDLEYRWSYKRHDVFVKTVQRGVGVMS